MTITYTGHVANARLCAFSKLLFYWKGSIYKLMYKEMAIFCGLYVVLSLIYRNILTDPQRRTFERVALYCESFSNLIPLSFVLGFYVALVIARWWNQYMSIPWPDRVMMFVTTMIEGLDEQGKLIRRTLMRYLSLGSIIVFQATSVRVKKRFPTMDHLIEAGVVTPAEVKMLEDISTPHGKWWIPFVWCVNILKDAHKQGRIADSYLLKCLIDEIMTYRGNLGMLYSYDWISVPLVYTQVTTLAVYTFFLGCTLGRQFLDPEQNYPGHNVDLYVPLFTLLQFFFYMGWLKVAEQLINPFGEDDDDFEMNWIIDRNMQVSLLTADDLCGQFPSLEKDIYFGEAPPDYLPYTKSSAKNISLPHMGSTAEIRISDEGMKVLSPLETIQEGVALSNTVPKNIASQLNTPIQFHHRNQNLMSGTRSPTDVLSRTSLYSCGKDSEDLHSSNLQVPLSTSLVDRARDTLGRWFSEHSSRVDLNKGHGANVVLCRESSLEFADRQPPDTADAINHVTRLPMLPEHYNLSSLNIEVASSVPTTSKYLNPSLGHHFQTNQLQFLNNYMPRPRYSTNSYTCDDEPPNFLTDSKENVEKSDSVASSNLLVPSPPTAPPSNSSNDEYEGPEQHQSTVTSMTPLLLTQNDINELP